MTTTLQTGPMKPRSRSRRQHDPTIKAHAACASFRRRRVRPHNQGLESVRVVVDGTSRLNAKRVLTPRHHTSERACQRALYQLPHGRPAGRSRGVVGGEVPRVQGVARRRMTPPHSRPTSVVADQNGPDELLHDLDSPAPSGGLVGQSAPLAAVGRRPHAVARRRTHGRHHVVFGPPGQVDRCRPSAHLGAQMCPLSGSRQPGAVDELKRRASVDEG
jgi:hypothetical protein